MFRRQPQPQSAHHHHHPHHQRDSTASASSRQPVSPLQPSFDFGLDSLSSPISASSDPLRFSGDSARPHTSDGSGAQQRRSTVSLSPPVLPPIPRVASRREPEGRFMPRDSSLKGRGNAREESDSVSATSNRVSAVHPTLRAEGSRLGGGLDGMAASQPTSATAGNILDIDFDRPKMEASMFPKPEVPVLGNAFAAGHPAMSRSFIDSRDKPYSQPPVMRPPPVQSTHSSPDMLSPRSFQSGTSARSPLSPYSSTSPGSRMSPRSVNSYTAPGKAASLAASSRYSGSTARPSTQGSSMTAASPLSVSTIGTAYQDTSSSYPLPRHVATRPQTSGTSSTIAGVMVPTHHTTGKRDDKGKTEKRKTKLLNPMALLVRRRSGQDAPVVIDHEELRAHAMAQARQKSVATAGINKLPEDFDPRIRGKIVHDFNAPRPRRNYSYSDASPQSPPSSGLQSPGGAPKLPALGDLGQQPQRPAIHNKNSSESSTRQSRHTPIFIEHLTEDPDSNRRISSIQAERLENKNFLHRASQHSSHHTNLSQESATLPPFARRSQQMDPMQASLFRDDESRRSSSDPPVSAKARSSGSSSFGIVSPLQITRQSGGLLGDARASMSPISPESPDKSRRPGSDTSATRQFSPVVSQRSVSSPEQRGPQFEDERALSPATEALKPEPLSPRTAPGTLTLPPRNPTLIPSAGSSPGFGSSIASTPEPAILESAIAAKQPSSPARLVEKLASAVGHSKRLSTGMPKHNPSTASRFSFQMGGSAEEETALEEKHRKMAASGDYSGSTKQKRGGPADDEGDEDDYFDEDAMDDEDEMEVQLRDSASLPQGDFSSLAPPNANGPFGLQNARQQLQHDSDDGSVYDEDEIPQIRRESEIPYAEHPAFRAHSALAHSRHHSMQPSVHRASGVDEYMAGGYLGGYQGGQGGQHQRFASNSSALTVDARGNGFYMQPEPAGHAGSAHNAGNGKVVDRGVQQDGRNGERGAVGDSRGSVTNGYNTAPSIQPDSTIKAPSWATESQVAAAPATGLGLSNFSDFVFTDGPDLTLSRPTSSQAGSAPPTTQAHHTRGVSSPLSRSGDWNDLAPTPLVSPGVKPTGGWGSMARSPPAAHISSPEDSAHASSPKSAAYHGSVGKGIRARNTAVNQNSQYAASETDEDGQDDMYFDDGGFDNNDNMNDADYHEHSVNEADFDNPDFLGGYKGMQARGHQRDVSALSLDAHGPYPTFAIPNPAKARQRESRLLLEDLPLQAPVDPRWIPQRNPSEDAKRLGLSNKVPPLPPQPGSGHEVVSQTQSNLQAYHQALADAANKAAGEGRFLRIASVSTARSGSVYSKVGEEGRDDGSYDAEGEAAVAGGQANGNANGNGFLAAPAPAQTQAQTDVGRSTSQTTTTSSRYDTDTSYSPPKMSFDFGFGGSSSATEAFALPGGYASSNVNAAASYDTVPPLITTQHYNAATTSPYLHTTNNNAAPSDAHTLPPTDNHTFLTDAFNDSYDEEDDYMNDPSVIAAANAEVLASDDAAFYGQEFGFYAQARRPSTGSEATHGGFFGDEGVPIKNAGDRGFLPEPNLTPITERSEFSTRNSFIGGPFGASAHFGPPSASAGGWATGYASPALARLPVSPLVETDVAGFEQLRKLRLGGAGGAAAQSPTVSSARNSQTHSGYFGHYPGSAGGVSAASGAIGGMGGTNGSTSPAVRSSLGWGESPVSASGSGKGMPFSQQAQQAHLVHSRNGSGNAGRSGWI